MRCEVLIGYCYEQKGGDESKKSERVEPAMRAGERVAELVMISSGLRREPNSAPLFWDAGLRSKEAVTGVSVTNISARSGCSSPRGRHRAPRKGLNL